MSSSTAAATTKRKRPAFSPPRPKASRSDDVSKVRTSKPNKRVLPQKSQKSKERVPTAPDGSDDSEVNISESESYVASTIHPIPPESEPDYVLAEVTRKEAAENDEPSVPSELIYSLLHHHFNDKNKMRMTNDAKVVVGKYVDTFVKEAIARTAFERQEINAEGGAGGLTSRGDDGWLEVEDLERMAPQLVLDF